MGEKDDCPAAASHHEEGLQDLEDGELETLSLCDLPLYSDEHEDDDDPLKEKDGLPQSKIGHGDDDPFEFSSKDLSASDSYDKMCKAEDLIFCGRLIPYGKVVPAAINGALDRARDKIVSGRPDRRTTEGTKKKKKWRFFKWRFSSMLSRRRHCSRSPDRSNRNPHHILTRSDCLPFENYAYVDEKGTNKYSFSTARQPGQSGRARCRWYVLMFRPPARFPIGMGLQDMKTRQSCMNLSSSTLSRSLAGDDDGNGNIGAKCSRNGNWGMWRLLRALSFSSGQQYGTAAAAISKIS
ncbi:hypothetical protein SAY86_030682 [Trapa natans]|uniref:Uncharacterized protein n=1 Tax=Trapa natans TaxID=22666 RepID=A0AAN7M3C9_TRANT|nr:hypothetical protein SAY86_030682 [Trapa natans]